MSPPCRHAEARGDQSRAQSPWHPRSFKRRGFDSRWGRKNVRLSEPVSVGDRYGGRCSEILWGARLRTYVPVTKATIVTMVAAGVMLVVGSGRGTRQP